MSNDQAQRLHELLNTLSPLMPPILGEYDSLNKRVKEDPHDQEAWRELVTVVETSGDIEKISTSYDALLLQYPNIVSMPTSFFMSHLYRILRQKCRYVISTFLHAAKEPFRGQRLCSTSSWKTHRVLNFGRFIWLMFGVLFIMWSVEHNLLTFYLTS